MTLNTAPKGNEREHLLSALLVDALHHRQTNGQSTTLRDLHAILDVSQPVALRVVRQLEQEGVAIVQSNLSDAFASEISISERTLNQLERARSKGVSRSG